MTVVTEVKFEEDQPLEVGLPKVKEVLQERRGKIIDLEARVVPTPPPEELERREAEMKETMSHLTDFERECQQLYNDAEKTWNRLIENENPKKASQNVK